MPLSVGIIGAGEIVTNGHLPVLKALSQFRVEWITDADAEKAGSVARAYGVRAITLPANPGDLPPVDIFLLAIPFGARGPYYSAFESRGSALYVEKPFARTVKQHREICAPRQPFQIACGLQRRSSGTAQLMRRVVEGGLFGKLQRMSFEFGKRGRISTGSHQSKLALAGGGLLFEVGVHGVDACLFIAGARAIEVHSANMVVEQGFDIHTDCLLTIERRNGDRVEAQFKVTCLEDTSERVHCTFEHATVSFSLFSGGDIQVRPPGGGEPMQLSDPLLGVRPQTGFEKAAHHWLGFARGLDEKQPNWTSAMDSVLTTEALERIYELGEQR